MKILFFSFLILTSMSTFATDEVLQSKIGEIKQMRLEFLTFVQPKLNLASKVDVYRILEVGNKKKELKQSKREICEQAEELSKNLSMFTGAISSLSSSSLRVVGHTKRADIVDGFKTKAARSLLDIANANFELIKEACLKEKPDSTSMTINTFGMNEYGFLALIDLLLNEMDH